MITTEHGNVWPGPVADSSPNCPGKFGGLVGGLPGEFVDVAGDLCPLRFLFAFYQAELCPPGAWRAKVLTEKGIKK